MSIDTSPKFSTGGADTSLAAVLSALSGHDDLPLAIQYGDRIARRGYHITEVKAGAFVTLDCGGNPDAWQETILQVEDLPAGEAERPMTAGKFRRILAEVDAKVRLNGDARLTVEIGRPDDPMQVFDVAGIVVGDTELSLRLDPRAAICKPRHRAQIEQAQSACCTPKSDLAGARPCCG
jgi:hypothetical protein